MQLDLDDEEKLALLNRAGSTGGRSSFFGAQ